jgi:outer membrane protein assembly factor BamD (BamD/ComL family)
MATTTTATSKTTAPASPAPAAAAPAFRAPAWLLNPKLVGGALLAVALVGGGIWFANSSAKRKEAFAGRALEQARSAAESGNLPLAASELQKITETYGGTRAATEAVLALNQVRMINNQAELAVVNLREFIASGPDRNYLAQAQALLGSALENTRKPVEAAESYAAAAKAADVDYLKAQYLLDAGRAWETAGKADEAIKSYREVTEKYGKTQLKTEAEVRLAELTKGQM